MYRSILKELNIWKQEEQRKVLMIRGARQVGKTYIVREFGQSFEYFIEVNFDETAAVHSFFEGNLDPDLTQLGTTPPKNKKISPFLGYYERFYWAVERLSRL